MMGFKATISSGSTSDIIKWIWETVFQMQTQQQNMSGYFCFTKCSNSISQSGMGTIGKLGPIGKITLYIMFQGKLALWLS